MSDSDGTGTGVPDDAGGLPAGDPPDTGCGCSVLGLRDVKVSRSAFPSPGTNVASGDDAPAGLPSTGGCIVSLIPTGRGVIGCPQIGQRPDEAFDGNGDLQAVQLGMGNTGFGILVFRFCDRTGGISQLTLVAMSHTSDLFNPSNFTCLPA